MTAPAPLDAAGQARIRERYDAYFTPVDLGNGAPELPHLGFDAAHELAADIGDLLATIDALREEITRLRTALTLVDDNMSDYDWQDGFPVEVEEAVRHALGHETYGERLAREKREHDTAINDTTTPVTVHDAYAGKLWEKGRLWRMGGDSPTREIRQIIYEGIRDAYVLRSTVLGDALTFGVSGVETLRYKADAEARP